VTTVSSDSSVEFPEKENDKKLCRRRYSSFIYLFFQSNKDKDQKLHQISP